MKIETLTYIEVENSEGQWAVKLDYCNQEMKPITPSYIFVHNAIETDSIYVDNTLTDNVPEKIVEGVNGGIADNFIEVGFWRIKRK